ncbi:hypothetical protein LEP1GSC086_3465 [Leptospira weilii str. LNT 1234]|nr:hypothetical protein LEP1GSC086_3465 [Leptospira weilii str. LNT 1234]
MLLFYFRSFKRKFCNFKGSTFCRVLPIKFKISNHKEFFRFMNAVWFTFRTLVVLCAGIYKFKI